MYSIEAEKTVIGSLLLHPDSCSEVFTILEREDFFDPYLGEVYKAIKEQFEAGGEVSVVLIADKLGPNNYTVLSSLLDYADLSSVAVESAKIVKDKAILRRISHNCREIIDAISDSAKSYDEIITEIERLILDISNYHTEDISHLREHIKELEARLTKANTYGLSTHYQEIDSYTGGLRPGELIVIAARPSVGKTAFAISIAYNLALNDIPVGIFSLEMSAVELAIRFLALVSGISIHQLRTGKRSMDELREYIERLSELPILINDSSLITTEKIRSILRRHRDVKVAIVDYIQLLQSEKKAENRVAEVSKITRDLKLIAKELGITIIAISQLSRAVEQRQNKRPMLSDLRESGAIEQEADIVMLLYREDYYKKDNKENTSTLEIEIAKNRNGPLSRVNLLFEKATNRFSDTSDVILEV